MLDRYLIQGGTLISLTDGAERQADILVEHGKIARIAAQIPADGAERIDASGMYVSPGWLEAHCHFACPGGDFSIDPTRDLLCQGITYTVDMGTLGPANYEACRKAHLYESDLRFRCYLNISEYGIQGTQKPMDFEGPQDIVPEHVISVAEAFRPELLGLKARIDDKFCFDPVYVMDRLRELGDRLQMPIAVHAPRSRIGIEKLLTYMKKGDVLCHTLAGNSEVMSVLDAQGQIKPCVLAARERGVIFDLSHGTNAYSYDTAEAAWKVGFFTDTISSDLHKRNVNGPVFNLGVILTKMRGLTGKPWWWLLEKAIVQPVKLQQIPGKEIEIREGADADLTVFRIAQGEFSYPDSKKESRTFHEKAEAIYTCVGEKVYACRA